MVLISAGKQWELFPYGKKNHKLADIYTDYEGLAGWPTANRDVIVPTYPNGALVNERRFPMLEQPPGTKREDLTKLENCRDMAYVYSNTVTTTGSKSHYQSSRDDWRT